MTLRYTDDYEDNHLKTKIKVKSFTCKTFTFVKRIALIESIMLRRLILLLVLSII